MTKGKDVSTTTEALQFIETLQEQGIKKRAATEIVSFVEKQRGDLATNQNLQAGINSLRNELEPLKRDGIWLKWIMGGVIAVMIGGFTAILTIMLYLHNDTKAEIDRRFTEIDRRFTEMDRRFTKMEAEMKEIKELLQERR